MSLKVYFIMSELRKYLDTIKDQFKKAKETFFSGEMIITLHWNQGGIRNGKIRLEKNIKLKMDS